MSKDNSQIFYLPTRSFCYFILLLLHISKKSKRSVKSNLYFSVIETNNFLKELRDGFFFLDCNLWIYDNRRLYIYIPRTCKSTIGDLLGMKNKKKMYVVEILRRRGRKGIE